jgi:hypothetical protein
MGLFVAKPVKVVIEEQPVIPEQDLTIGEIRVAHFASLVCELSQNATRDSDNMLTYASQVLGEDLAELISSLKIFDHNSLRAMTFCIDLNCKAIGFSSSETPLGINVLVFHNRDSRFGILNSSAKSDQIQFVFHDNHKEQTVVHAATEFYNNYKSLCNDTHFFNYVLKKAESKNRKLLVVGHSAGAAIAQCFVTDLIHAPVNKIQLALITFGSPR